MTTPPTDVYDNLANKVEMTTGRNKTDFDFLDERDSTSRFVFDDFIDPAAKRLRVK